jgi:arylsulfatase A-like enzyme
MRVLQYFLGALLLAGLVACEGETGKRPVKRAELVSGNGLNILMIAVDDLNTFVTHLDGHPNSATPNLDRIAAAGTSFSSAYAPAPACNPSRTALLTGKRPFKTGVYLNPEDDSEALREHRLISEHLARNGYKTLVTGKISHWIKDNPRYFEEVYVAGGSYTSDARLNGLNELDNNFDWGALDIADDNATPDFDRVNWAIGQLQKNHDAPFFLNVGIVRPHLPWTVPKQYFEQFPLDGIELPSGFLEGDIDDLPRGAKGEGILGDHEVIVAAGKWREGIQAYLASVAYADAAIGKLWDALQESEYKDNTVVILWGDHGWQFGEKERWRKFTLWSAGSQTTYIITAPGTLPQNQLCDAPVDLMSIYPSILALLGLPQRDDIDGANVMPLLETCGIPWTEPALSTNGRNNHAVRRDNWTYIQHANGDEELYDRSVDPWELTNLAGDPKTGALRDELAMLLPCRRYPLIGTFRCDQPE